MKEPIRILHWGIRGHMGGIATFLFSLYKSIDKSKVQFDFLIGHNEDIVFEDEIKAMGGNLYRVTYSKRESIVKSYKVLDDFFEKHKEFSGIHMHSCFINYSLPLRLAKKHNIPIRIFHSHNSQDMYPNRSIIKKIYMELERKSILSSATGLMACSNEAGAYMFKNREFKWIKNGIDVDKFKYSQEVRDKKRNELHISSDCIVMGFTGRLQYQKNPILLVEIFNEFQKKVENSKLVIVGDGEIRNEVEAKIKSLNIEEKVVILGNRNDANEMYQAMDIFVLPSRFEGFGIVLLEAQASGLKCFTTMNVPKEVEVTDNVYRNNTENPEEWASQIYNNYLVSTRNIDLKQFNEYDTRNVAKTVADYYINELKGIQNG